MQYEPDPSSCWMLWDFFFFRVHFKGNELHLSTSLYVKNIIILLLSRSCVILRMFYDVWKPREAGWVFHYHHIHEGATCRCRASLSELNLKETNHSFQASHRTLQTKQPIFTDEGRSCTWYFDFEIPENILQTCTHYRAQTWSQEKNMDGKPRDTDEVFSQKASCLHV